MRKFFLTIDIIHKETANVVSRSVEISHIKKCGKYVYVMLMDEDVVPNLAITTVNKWHHSELWARYDGDKKEALRKVLRNHDEVFLGMTSETSPILDII